MSRDCMWPSYGGVSVFIPWAAEISHLAASHLTSGKIATVFDQLLCSTYVHPADGGYRLKPAESFFEEQGEQSEVKANIVAKYFDAWSNVMLGAMRQFKHFDRIAY